MNDKITTDIISTTGINITKYDILPAKVFINGVEVTDTESWNKAISTFNELQDKINNLQSKIDKANELIKRKLSTETYQHLKKLYDDIDSTEEIWEDYEFEDLLDILKED